MGCAPLWLRPGRCSALFCNAGVRSRFCGISFRRTSCSATGASIADAVAPHVLIVGGGIGGLTAALSIKQRNPATRITIFEKSGSTCAPVGLGINLLPPCVKVLISLGLEVALRETAIETSALILAGNQGLHVQTEPRGLAAGHAAPQFSIHRGRLAHLLSDAVMARLGADSVKHNHKFVDFEEMEDRVIVRFDCEGGTTEYEGDAIVGADGLHSGVRKVLYPNEAKRYTGWVSWRGLTCMEVAPYNGSTMTIIGKIQEEDGRIAEAYSQAFVCYPIDEPSRKEGRALLNWVAEMAVEELPLEDEDWLIPVSKDDVAAAFKGFRYGPIAVDSLIADAAVCTKFVMYDRDPVHRWTFGRVTLLGDAAHPMLPFGSLGAGNAILDADALAKAMEAESILSSDGLLRALGQYERSRLDSANEVVLMCRKGALHKPLRDLCEQHRGQRLKSSF